MPRATSIRARTARARDSETRRSSPGRLRRRRGRTGGASAAPGRLRMRAAGITVLHRSHQGLAQGRTRIGLRTLARGRACSVANSASACVHRVGHQPVLDAQHVAHHVPGVQVGFLVLPWTIPGRAAQAAQEHVAEGQQVYASSSWLHGTPFRRHVPAAREQGLVQLPGPSASSGGTAARSSSAWPGSPRRIRWRMVAWIRRTLSTCATPPPSGPVRPPPS